MKYESCVKDNSFKSPEKLHHWGGTCIVREDAHDSLVAISFICHPTLHVGELSSGEQFVRELEIIS